MKPKIITFFIVLYSSKSKARKVSSREDRVRHGGNKFSNWSESVQQYFGEIEIEGNQKYYLGTFKGKVKIKFKNAISIQLENQIVPEKLKAVLKEQGTGWAEEEFKLIETVNREELIIY
ncbi:MAG: hypothetical protein IPO37_03130 [Saprospiraceae bacterium]|nr:hypothetical protein [Saprospiraceae bacterium]